MGSKASERLINAATLLEPHALGISAEAIGKIQVDDGMRQDLLRCLYDIDPAETLWGLYFCQGLLAAAKLDENITNVLIQQAPSLLESADNSTRVELVRILFMLRRKLPRY